MFFYGGVIFGYFVGIPLLYEILIEYNADGNQSMDLRESEYLRFFMLMTISFGLVMDIPWAILVMVRAGLVSPDQLAKQRKMILLGAVVAAAVLTPPDPMSQCFLFIMIVALFEGGLLVSRFIGSGIQDDQQIPHDFHDGAVAGAAEQSGVAFGHNDANDADVAPEEDEGAVAQGDDGFPSRIEMTPFLKTNWS